MAKGSFLVCACYRKCLYGSSKMFVYLFMVKCFDKHHSKRSHFNRKCSISHIKVNCRKEEKKRRKIEKSPFNLHIFVARISPVLKMKIFRKRHWKLNEMHGLFYVPFFFHSSDAKISRLNCCNVKACLCLCHARSTITLNKFILIFGPIYVAFGPKKAWWMILEK